MNKFKLLTVLLLIPLWWLTTIGNAAAPAINTTTTTTTTVAPATTTIAPATTTTTTTVFVASTHPECAKWLDLAAGLGWQEDAMPMLERVMWKESRCRPRSFNATDPNGGSIGLTQINRFWCLGSRYHPNGYLQAHGVLNTCDDLFNPATNLLAALAIYNYAQGWSQWGL